MAYRLHDYVQMNIDLSANVARVRRRISPLLPNQIAHHSCASGTHVDRVQKHRFASDPTRRKHMNSPLLWQVCLIGHRSKSCMPRSVQKFLACRVLPIIDTDQKHARRLSSTKLPRGFPTLLVTQSGWVLRAPSLADPASDRVRLMRRGPRRLAPAS
jgi:hypothetical protein